MSFSKPFFGDKVSYKKSQLTIADDKAYMEMHWTEQLRLKPLRNRQRWSNETGDFSTYSDMMWDFDNDKETSNVI